MEYTFPVAFFLEPISSILEYEDLLLLIPVLLQSLNHHLLIKLYFLWFFLTWQDFLFNNILHFYKYHISDIHYLLSLWVPNLITSETIFIPNKDTLFILLIQLTHVFLWNMNIGLIAKLYLEMCDRRFLIIPYLLWSLVIQH